jgi:hypothetical protein
MTKLQAGQQVLDSRQGHEIFPSSLSKAAVGFTHPLI